MSNYYQPTPEQYMQMYAGYQMAPPTDSKETRSLYVGNLDTKVTDVLLWEIFFNSRKC